MYTAVRQVITTHAGEVYCTLIISYIGGVISVAVLICLRASMYAAVIIIGS